MVSRQDVAFADFGGETIDIGIVEGTLLSEEGLQTAVLISLFTDQYVPTDELPEGVEDPRGWWADAIAEETDDKIGSKLWLLDRGKINSANRSKMKEYTEDALQWLIDDGIASEIAVSTFIVQNQRIDLEISITRPTGENIPFKFLWDGQELKRVA